MASQSATTAKPVKDKYRLIGPVYDLLSNLYSGKNIHECKVAMLSTPHLNSGDKVLFAGVGHGSDAIHAAEKGAEVTVVDLSETMLRKFQESLVKQGKTHLNIRQVHADIFTVSEQEQYDMVVGNFFLNVFPEDLMNKVLKHLISLAKPGGKVVVGDFAMPSGNPFARLFKQAYWYIAVSLFWLTSNNAMHQVYDYAASMQESGLKVQEKKYYELLGMDCYCAILGEKTA